MDIQLDFTSDRPIYRQLADALRLSINSGELKPGDPLPSGRSLGAELNLALGTVREAINLLKAEGMIETRAGRGAFVRSNPPVRRLASDRFARRHRESGRGAYGVDMGQVERVPQVDQIKIGYEVRPPDDVAERLHLLADELVVVRSRRYMADREPMELAVSYIPWVLAKGTQIVEEDTGPGGIYARIEELGLRLESFSEEVTSRMPTPEEARSLIMGPGIPVIEVIRVAYAEGGRPVEECDTVMRSDRYILHYDFPAE